jgi:LPS-assembly protein
LIEHVRSAVIIFTGLLVASHAVRPPPAIAQGATATVTTPGGDVTILADRLEEVAADNLIIATGNVEITKGTSRLLADRVEINRETGAAVAEGRVLLYDGIDRLVGERIEYNLKSGTGVVYEARSSVSPYYRIDGERMERLGEGQYHVRRGVFTTCEADPPAWSFRFREGDVDLEEGVTGRGGAFWVENFPLLPVFPFFAAAIRRERQSGFLFPRFGASGFKGAFIELPFYWVIADNVDATVTLNEYTKRGTGGSGEIRYVLSDTARGNVGGFFLKEYNVNESGTGHDDNRGFWRFQHNTLLAPGLALKADINGASDDQLLRDYGDALYQRSAQRLDSNIFLTWTTQNWNVVGNLYWYQDLTTSAPIELNRLPEITVTRNRTPVPGIPGLSWDFEGSATKYVRELGSDGTRIDVHPRLIRPVSVFGFFTISPFVGGRVTAYDKTALGSFTQPDGLVVDTVSDKARVRSFVETGADLEARAARVYMLTGFNNVDAALHSIEPRVNYTLIEGNNFGKIPNWGSPIDVIPRTSLLTYSLINRIRARTIAPEGTEPQRWEFLRFTLGQTYDFGAVTKPFGNLAAELIIDPSRIVRFRGDTSLSPYVGGFQTGSTDLALTLPALTASVGTRYNRSDQTNFFQGSVSADVTRWATARFITNWDIHTDTFVENRYGVDIKYQCWAFSIEYVQRSTRGDELRFAINLLGLGAPISTGTGIGSLTGATGQPTAGKIR